MSEKDNNQLTGLEIAVIGMVGRFPGAKDIDEFWKNLKNGIESISFFSDEELEETGIDPGLIHHPGYIKAKGVIAGVEYFDALLKGFQDIKDRTGKEIMVVIENRGQREENLDTEMVLRKIRLKFQKAGIPVFATGTNALRGLSNAVIARQHLDR